MGPGSALPQYLSIPPRPPDPSNFGLYSGGYSRSDCYGLQGTHQFHSEFTQFSSQPSYPPPPPPPSETIINGYVFPHQFPHLSANRTQLSANSFPPPPPPFAHHYHFQSYHFQQPTPPTPPGHYQPPPPLVPNPQYFVLHLQQPLYQHQPPVIFRHPTTPHSPLPSYHVASVYPNPQHESLNPPVNYPHSDSSISHHQTQSKANIVSQLTLSPTYGSVFSDDRDCTPATNRLKQIRVNQNLRIRSQILMKRKPLSKRARYSGTRIHGDSKTNRCGTPLIKSAEPDAFVETSPTAVPVMIVAVVNECRNQKSTSKHLEQKTHLGNHVDMLELNSQLKQFVKICNVKDARKMFFKRPKRDAVSWTGYLAKSGIVNSVIVGSALLDLYMKVVGIENGCIVFDKMPLRNVVSGTTIITGEIGEQVQIVGDNLLVTNPKRGEKAIKEKSCNALLFKVNQIGSVTKSVEVSKRAGQDVTANHRSGATEGNFIADLIHFLRPRLANILREDAHCIIGIVTFFSFNELVSLKSDKQSLEIRYGDVYDGNSCSHAYFLVPMRSNESPLLMLLTAIIHSQIMESVISSHVLQDTIFEKKHKQALNKLEGILTDPLKAQEALELMFQREATNILKEMLLCYKPNAERFLSLMLQLLCASKLAELHSRTQIFVQNGSSLMECLFETRTLKYGQVFVQCSDHAIFNGSTTSTAGQDNFTIECNVIIAKNPCLHFGDERFLMDGVSEVSDHYAWLLDFLTSEVPGTKVIKFTKESLAFQRYCSMDAFGPKKEVIAFVGEIYKHCSMVVETSIVLWYFSLLCSPLDSDDFRSAMFKLIYHGVLLVHVQVNPELFSLRYLKNYLMLYSISDKNVQEIKISPGLMLLIFNSASTHVLLKIMAIEDGTVLKAFNNILHRNKVSFIEQFNEKLLVKQENENLQILDVRNVELLEVNRAEFLTSSSFIILYENQLFLTFKNRTMAVWNAFSTHARSDAICLYVQKLFLVDWAFANVPISWKDMKTKLFALNTITKVLLQEGQICDFLAIMQLVVILSTMSLNELKGIMCILHSSLADIDDSYSKWILTHVKLEDKFSVKQGGLL